jgi:phage terminase large subunit-like protein
VLRWNASNVSVWQDVNENIRPDKRRSSEKIDGVVALILAMSRAMLQREPERSVYEDRGITVL